MINYTPQNQLSLSLFKHPFQQELDKENRWVKLAKLVPWDELATIYSQHLQSNTGRQSVNVRTVIAALIIKHKLNLDDRGTVEMIQENIYLQYFCGLKEFTTQRVFDPSLFVDIRKRLGGEEFDSFNKLVIEKSEQMKPYQSRIKKKNKSDDEDQNDSSSSTSSNRGTLKVDATVADQEIRFPTDLNLLNAGREHLEHIIDILYKQSEDVQKPRDYRRVARKNYLNISKKKRKSKKLIRKGIKAQLQYIARDLKIIDKQTDKAKGLQIISKREKLLIETIKKMYAQQKWMYENKKNVCANRIVSLYQPHVRPIVRGKEGRNTEFGSKINASEVNGFSWVNTLSWDAFNEGCDLKNQVEDYRKIFNCYPKTLLADGIYLTRENRKYLKAKGIKIYGKPLGRPPKQEAQTPAQKHYKKKKAAERNHVEAKFGQAKRGYGLNNIKARLPETSESWVNAIFFVMNLTQLLKVAKKYPEFFVRILNFLQNELIKIFFKIFLFNKPKYLAVNQD